MKLDQIYENKKALRTVINTVLDFIDVENLTDSAITYIKDELNMSEEDAADLVMCGIQ